MGTPPSSDRIRLTTRSSPTTCRSAVFGDMNLEVFDASGTFVSAIPTSKRKGLSRLAGACACRRRTCRPPQARRLAR